MGGVEGIRFISLNISTSGTSTTLSDLLMSGAILRGRIAAEGALLNLVVAGQRIPLPKSVALPPGTAVEVQLSQESGTPQLRLQVLPTPAQPAPGQPSVSMPSDRHMVKGSLPAALAMQIRPEEVDALLPKAFIFPPQAIATVVKAFLSNPELGRRLAEVLPLLEGQVAQGQMSPEVAAQVRATIEAMDAKTPEDFRQAVEVARKMIGAAASRTPATSERPVNTPLDDLFATREHASMLLKTAGNSEFVRVVDSVLNRLDHLGLQNIRALDTPYQFFVIPFAPQTGIDHAQVHVMGREGRGSGGGGGREAHFVALDLHLTNLGSLWITIQSLGPACSCVIRAEDERMRNAIDQGSPVLEAGLRRAGFTAAQVRTEAWDGDRVGAAAALLSRPSSFEAEA